MGGYQSPMVILSARLVAIDRFGSGYRTLAGGTQWVKAPTPAPRSVFGAGRPANWKEALSAFSDSPWLGDHQGGAHSFILGAAQTMGLAFLLPFGIVVWIV